MQLVKEDNKTGELENNMFLIQANKEMLETIDSLVSKAGKHRVRLSEYNSMDLKGDIKTINLQYKKIDDDI